MSLSTVVARRMVPGPFPMERILSNTKNSNKLANSPIVRHRNFSSKKREEIPPPLPSPSKAKQEYLKTRKEFLQDPQAKLTQLNQELETVRDRAASKLDAELNKSVWRKLTDPLRRHKHSMINIGAMCLAYMLAYTLFIKSKAEKEARRQLAEAEETNRELQAVLQSLLETTTIQQIAQECLQDMDIENQTKASTSSSSWFGGSTTSRRGMRTQQQQSQQESLQWKLQDALEKQLAQRIGEQAMTEEQKQQKSIQDVWEESKSQVKALNENPEKLLIQAILEEEQKDAQNDKPTKQRRVFSM